MKLAFLYYSNCYYYVKIAANHSWVAYNSKWMVDSDLGDSCQVPDIDLLESTHKFDCESEAIKFLAEFYKNQLA